MALLIKGDKFKGLAADCYYRFRNTGARSNGSLNQQLVVEKYSSEEYRADNLGDCINEVYPVEYTEEELQQLEAIHYMALKRTEKFVDAEDC